MKKTLFAISAIAVLLGFTACTSENETLEPQVSGKTITLKAYTEEATRTALDGNDTDGYKVVWSDGDQIKFGTTNDYVFTLKSGKGTSVAEFEGTAPAEGKYAVVYPANYNGMPTEQTYVKDNIPQGVPMMATGINVDADGNVAPISFKNMGGILRLTLKLNEGDAARSVKRIVVSSTQLADEIVLNCETAVALTEEGVPFHIAMLAKEYTDLKFTIYDDGGYKCVRSLGTGKTLKVERSKITPVNLTAKSWEFFGLCFTAAEASTLNICYNGDNLEYSLNDGVWTGWANNTNISMESGDKVYLRLITGKTWNASYNTSTFSMAGSLAADGSIMTLIDRTGLSKEIPYTDCFWWLFKDCESLTSSPELPATTLSVQCYYEMFYGCTNLTTAPELPATTLAVGCYELMFYKCSSLTTAPVLNAPILVERCYQDMFNGCKKLKAVTCLATDISALNCVAGWLTSAGASGTIYVAHGMKSSWAAPSRWSIVELE